MSERSTPVDPGGILCSQSENLPCRLPPEERPLSTAHSSVSNVDINSNNGAGALEEIGAAGDPRLPSLSFSDDGH